MSEITAITPQIKDKRRCNVYVDGRFYCGLTLEAAIKNRLKVGQTVDGAFLSAIQLESEKSTALDKALTHISATRKTEREIRKYLADKGYLPAVCDYVVEKMLGYGFIDDGAYAREYTEAAAKKKGRRLIRAELKQKGISDEEIGEATEEIEGEEETAKRLLEKYLRGKALDRGNLQKGFRYLIGKGFEYETARRAIAALGEVEDE
ncbi:MAG: RecX family transcriptional regulator [Clostridia bacterium]|nr:RecX family transcriptional regulator [Clostridia bacterium]